MLTLTDMMIRYGLTLTDMITMRQVGMQVWKRQYPRRRFSVKIISKHVKFPAKHGGIRCFDFPKITNQGNNSKFFAPKQNKEDVKNREIRYLPDLAIFNLLSIFVLVQRILNYYPNYPTHRLYFGEVETLYSVHRSFGGTGVLAAADSNSLRFQILQTFFIPK